jgi:hypothetical protein
MIWCKVIARVEISNNEIHVLTVGNVYLPLKRDSFGLVEVMVGLVECIDGVSGSQLNVI